MVLVGYLENCPTDRGLERLFQMRLDLRYFIDHDVDESIPDHSTICKTRKRIPQEIFTQVFDHILGLCIDEGMVSGHTQAIDSAYKDANASLDNMEQIDLKERDPDIYLKEIFDQDLPDDYTIEDKKARLDRKHRDHMVHKRYRERKYKEQDKRKNNKRRVLSNVTHMSKSDPDARIAVKPGKPRMLCYTSKMSVDIQDNVITNIAAEHASKKDSQLLIKNIHRTEAALNNHGLSMNAILADAGFSSGENYQMQEQLNLTGYIPTHGTYVSNRGEFRYDGRRNAFICSQGQALKTTYFKSGEGRKVAVYRSKKKICNKCPMSKDCVGRRGIKEIQSTPFKREYERMKKRLKSKKGKTSYYKRMQSVEPVFGSLQQYYGLRRIYVRGKNSGYKVMLMSAAAFNLKKWIRKKENECFLSLKLVSFNIKNLSTDFFNFSIFKNMSFCGGCQVVRCI